MALTFAKQFLLNAIQYSPLWYTSNNGVIIELLSALNVVLVGPLFQFNSSYNIRKRFVLSK